MNEGFLVDSSYELNYTHIMSKRLQVLFPDNEFNEIQKISQLNKQTIAQWVRDSIRSVIIKNSLLSPEKKIAKLLKYTKYSGPAGEIHEILKQIEKGKNL